MRADSAFQRRYSRKNSHSVGTALNWARATRLSHQHQWRDQSYRLENNVRQWGRIDFVGPKRKHNQSGQGHLLKMAFKAPCASRLSQPQRKAKLKFGGISWRISWSRWKVRDSILIEWFWILIRRQSQA